MGAHYLNDSSVEFELVIADETFDNDDNEYGKVVFHNYINMENSTDIEDAKDEV